MNGRAIDLGNREVAAAVRDRLTEFLAACEALRQAEDDWGDGPLSLGSELTKEEQTAIIQITDLEQDIIDRALDAALADFLAMVLEQVVAIVETRH